MQNCNHCLKRGCKVREQKQNKLKQKRKQKQKIGKHFCLTKKAMVWKHGKNNSNFFEDWHYNFITILRLTLPVFEKRWILAMVEE